MKQTLSEEFRKMQKLAGIITEVEYKKLIESEEYTLHIKNDHPSSKIDKKIKIDFDPLTMFGGWDEDELKELFAKEKLVSGTYLELMDSNNESIKKGQLTGYMGGNPIISDK
jgi:hypothetical protein